MSAMCLTDSEVAKMIRFSTEQFNKEVDYFIAKLTLDGLLKNGLITEQDYAKIDTIIAKKYGSILCDLCR